jgi:hypothetical protein
MCAGQCSAVRCFGVLCFAVLCCAGQGKAGRGAKLKSRGGGVGGALAMAGRCCMHLASGTVSRVRAYLYGSQGCINQGFL